MELWLRYQKPLAFGSEVCLARFTPGRRLELGRGRALLEPGHKHSLLPARLCSAPAVLRGWRREREALGLCLSASL